MKTNRHKLEIEYGLECSELLDAIDQRFRAKVTLEGAVAEVKLSKILDDLTKRGKIVRFEKHDLDGYPDYSVWIKGRKDPILVECKNVRNSDEAYRAGGKDVAYKVETQKTRTSNDDRRTRFYDADQFHILAVCLGKKTRNWSNFLFITSPFLRPHLKFAGKLAAMQRVPLPDSQDLGHWTTDFTEALSSYAKLTR